MLYETTTENANEPLWHWPKARWCRKCLGLARAAAGTIVGARATAARALRQGLDPTLVSPAAVSGGVRLSGRQGCPRRSTLDISPARSGWFRGSSPQTARIRASPLLTKGAFCQKSDPFHAPIHPKTHPKSIWRLVIRVLGLGRQLLRSRLGTQWMRILKSWRLGDTPRPSSLCRRNMVARRLHLTRNARLEGTVARRPHAQAHPRSLAPGGTRAGECDLRHHLGLLGMAEG